MADFYGKYAGIFGGGGGGGGSTPAPFQEIPAGTINSSNVTFTLANNPNYGLALLLFLDGLALVQGVDYTISGQTITMTSAPLFGQQLYAYYSVVTTGGGGGSVTGVTASAPLASSGGTAPNITITQANTSTNGYLSSTDWNTFNGKQAALTIGNLTDVGTDGITVGNGTGSVIGTGTTISQHVADATHNGYLASADWSTFNSKQSALTLGNLTGAGTDGITVTNGTGAVVGTGTSFSQHVADATHNGYLSSADWSTFNGKQASGNYLTALTGDGSASGPGSATFTLATVNSNVGSFGSATQVAGFTVNGKGLITAASNTSIQIAESQVTNLTTDLAGKQASSTSLTNLAALAGNGIVAQTGANTFANRTITGTTNHIASTNGDGVSGNPTLDLAARITDTQLEAAVYNGGSVLTTGPLTRYFRVPFDCTIQSWNIVANASGSIQFDVWVAAYASFPPTVANTITGSAKPILSSARTATSSTLTGWTTSLSKNSYVIINIDSVSTITQVTLDLVITK